MKAVKGNRQYTIDERDQKYYQSSGFDIMSDDGKVIAYGRGKTVPFDVYQKLKDDFEALKEQMEEAKTKKASK